MVISQWASAGQTLFGASWIATPDGLLTESDALSFATLTSRGRSHVSRVRKLVPEELVTLSKDTRSAWRYFRSQSTEVELPPTGQVAFVMQHHSLFQRRGIDVADRLGVPIVIGVESLQISEASSWGVKRPGWGGFLERYGEHEQLKRADVVTAVSEELADQLAGIVGSDRVVVTENKADLRLHEGLDREHARTQLGVTNEVVVGWVGSFRPFHGLDVILKGFEQLLAQVPDAVLLLVGDGPERPMCEQFAQRIGVDRVRMPGMLPFQEVPAQIAAFDLAVIGARASGGFHYSPLKLQEYLAAGVPVVAPDVGQISSILADGTAGVMFEAGDVSGLASALELLAKDPRKRKTMSVAAKARAAELGSAAGEMQKVCDRLGLTPREATRSIPCN